MFQESCSPTVFPEFPTTIWEVIDLQAAYIFLGWFIFQLVLYVLPTGKIHEGIPLKNGARLKYRCNGKLHIFFCTDLS